MRAIVIVIQHNISYLKKYPELGITFNKNHRLCIPIMTKSKGRITISIGLVAYVRLIETIDRVMYLRAICQSRIKKLSNRIVQFHRLYRYTSKRVYNRKRREV